MLILFSYNEKSTLLLAGVIVGCLLACLLGWKWIRQQSHADKWLSAFMVLGVLYISLFMLGYAGWYTQEFTRNILYYVPFQQLLLIGPVLFVYTQSLLAPTYRPGKRDMLHFLPALVYNLAMLYVFLNDQIFESDHYFYADDRDMDLDPWYQWAGLASMVIYLSLSIRRYKHYERIVLDVLSYAEELLFRWMQQFLVAFLAILLLRVLFFILNPEWGEFGSKFWYYLSFTVLFNYIGFRGYLHSVQLEAGARAAATHHALIQSSLEMQEEVQSRQPAPPPDLVARMERYMEDAQAYKNPRLTLAEVANQLQTPQKTISTAVNSEYSKNFNDWVNAYRVADVLRKFDAGLHKTQTILALALDAGFNSKSTFNRAFKKHTGTTPVRYLEKLPA